jgi:hypothetical protein
MAYDVGNERIFKKNIKYSKVTHLTYIVIPQPYLDHSNHYCAPQALQKYLEHYLPSQIQTH